MYKRLLTALAFSLCTSAAMAQAPTLTAATTNPQIGDMGIGYLISATDPGSAGANVTWDFSSYNYTATDTEYYSPCSASPYCSDFPGTTIYGHQSMNGITLYMNESNTRQSLTGEYSLGPVPYTDYEDYFHYPCTYNDSYVDTFGGTFTSGSQFVRKGTITVTADGYGTLILPYGTIDNVLRIHRMEVYSDSVVGAAFGFSYVSNLYTWYSPAHRMELMDITTISISGQAGPSNSYYTKDLSTTSAVEQVTNTGNTLEIFPNPAKGQLNIRFENKSSDAVRISLVDVVGKEIGIINNSPLGNGMQQISYPTSGLSAGLYFVRLQTANGAVTKKVEIL